MDVQMVNPFITAIYDVLPQLGFQNIKRNKLSVGEKYLKSFGVIVLVGFSKGISGNVAYNMSMNTACVFASTMMMGAPVLELNSIAESAISELANMLTAQVATKLSSQNHLVDISTPNLTIGEDVSLCISDNQYLIVELDVDGKRFEVDIKID